MKATREQIKHRWFGADPRLNDEQKLDYLLDFLNYPKDAPHRWELERDAEVKVFEMLKAKIDEADEAIGDYLEDQYVELFRPNLEELETEGANAWVEARQRGGEMRLAMQLMPTVWVMGAAKMDPNRRNAGTLDGDWEFEVFDERPNTPCWDPTNDWSNWPEYYVLFEASPNGGDSILIEADRELTAAGEQLLQDRHKNVGG